jgi:hypothetical protein
VSAHLGTYYGGAAWAIRDERMQAQAFLRPGRATEDARAAVLEMALDTWPVADGWHGHGAAVAGADLLAEIIAVRSEG